MACAAHSLAAAQLCSTLEALLPWERIRYVALPNPGQSAGPQILTCSISKGPYKGAWQPASPGAALHKVRRGP